MSVRDESGMLNAFSGRTENSVTQSLIERRERLLGPAYRLFYDEPLHIVRGEGVWLHDRDGKSYLDAYNNVAAVGHCHPHVVEAITRQAWQLNTHTRYLHETILEYSERLLATFPEALANVMFTCTGSEANDLAIRVAQNHTGGTGLIVTELAYHGVTQAVAQMSPSLGAHVPLGPHVRVVRAPDGFRNANPGQMLAEEVRKSIADMTRTGIRVAALVCDTIFASDGIFPGPKDLLKEAVDVVRAAGGLFVADEVQAGFCRTGDAMWGFERFGVVPDIATLGKAMGNGHPIAAAVFRPDVIGDFGQRARYFNTFGGNPVSCAAALATLEVIEKDGLQENSRQVGTYLRDGLSAVALHDGRIGDVRGAGLYTGVELVVEPGSKVPDGALAQFVVNHLRANGILISATGLNGNVLKIRPPLVFEATHADQLVDRLSAALSASRNAASERVRTHS